MRRLFLMLVVTIVLGASVVSNALAGIVDFATLSHFGGAGSDAGNGVGFLPDDRIVYGGRSTGGQHGLAEVTSLFGGGDGVVSVFDPTGTQLQSIVRVGSEVRDLDVRGGIIGVAAANAGVVVLNSDGKTVRWSDTSTGVQNVSRISVGNQGTVAVLTGTGTHNYSMRVYDSAGALQVSRSFADTVVADIVVDDSRGQVIVTGYNNGNTGLEPAQVPFIRSYDQADLAGTTKWSNYGWNASILRGIQNPNVADSRGVRVELGADDRLYFAGRADGGNTTFFFNPHDPSVQLSRGSNPTDTFIIGDRYANAFNTQSQAKTIFGRFDPINGDVENLQWLLTRTPENVGNTLVTFGIAADESGNMFLTGQAWSMLADRDNLIVNGDIVGPYAGGGELFVAKISSDFMSREYWTALTELGRNESFGTGIAYQNGRIVFSGTVPNELGSLLATDNAFQSTALGGAEGYFGIHGTITAVPEPSSLEMLCTFGAGILFYRRRRKGKNNGTGSIVFGTRVAKCRFLLQVFRFS